MPSDTMIDKFIKGLNNPEFVFVIGILIILAYVAVKALPMLESIRLTKLENEKNIETMKLEHEQRREERKTNEFQKELELNRQRTEVIGKQNEILESLTRSADSQTLQMAGLMAAIEESKIRSRNMGDTINDTNSKVSEIHTMIVKANHSK